MKILHPIEPLFDEGSKILILGSFPSVKSREVAFFYGHPQNRFWRVISKVFCEEIPQTVEEKREMLCRNHIALWDVIGACEIEGSADSTIKNVQPNDIGRILSAAAIRQIFVNGKTAKKYYDRYILKDTRREAICLPSTSPANAGFSLERLYEEWKIIRSLGEEYGK